MTFNSYTDTVDWLYNQLAVFQRDGGAAYKPGLQTASELSAAFGNPQCAYPTIHIAGTNGKGSTAHTLAAILQSAGYKVGLYTSPHLVDFRERMRVNGTMISKDEVIDFVNRYIEMNLPIHPSFFELTMVMAFEYFYRSKVDVAVIETGLGGRLDSTNIITPVLSVITNISFDHTQFLGNTLVEIAGEKAGIIKPGVPVVVGEAEGDVRDVFAKRAEENGSSVVFAGEVDEIEATETGDSFNKYRCKTFGDIVGELSGEWQVKNAATILESVKLLRAGGFDIPDSAVIAGFKSVCSLTGLAGRWMVLPGEPNVICDTGHNTGGWKYLTSRIASLPGIKHLVIGFVNDKDVSGILKMMANIPQAKYYFATASVNRALPSADLREFAAQAGIVGTDYKSVAEAVAAAKAAANVADSIFIGGSTFIVADYLTSIG